MEAGGLVDGDGVGLADLVVAGGEVEEGWFGFIVGANDGEEAGELDVVWVCGFGRGKDAYLGLMVGGGGNVDVPGGVGGKFADGVVGDCWGYGPVSCHD